MKGWSRGPLGSVLFFLPLALPLFLLEPGYFDSEPGRVTVMIVLLLMTRYILGAKAPSIAFIALLIGASMVYPTGIYGESELLVAAVWVARFIFAAVAIFSVPYLMIRLHELLDRAFGGRDSASISPGVFFASLGWLCALFPAVLLAQAWAVDQEAGPAGLYRFSFGILSWIPLIVVTLPPLAALVVFGLERNRIWAVPFLLFLVAAIDTLTEQQIVMAVLILLLCGATVGSLCFMRTNNRILAALLATWGVGLGGLIQMMTAPAPFVLPAVVLAEVLSLAFLRCRFLPTTGSLAPVGAALRTVSPFHWLWDLAHPTLKKLDGPGPVWD